MIPIRLNLLSSEKQKHLKKTLHYQFIKSIFEITLIFACIGGMVLMGSQIILQDYFNELTSQITATKNQYSQTNLEIRDINKTIKEVKKIQEGYINWASLINEITKILPDEVILNALNIEATNKKIDMSGKAATRENLLELQKRAEKSEFVSSIEIPLSQLVEKENIDFSISVSITNL